MRAKRASEFRKIPQRSAIFRKTPQSSAECRKMPRNTVNSAEFCGTRILASLASSLMFCVILQITKLNVKLLNESDCVQHYPTSTVTDLLMNLEYNTINRREHIVRYRKLYLTNIGCLNYYTDLERSTYFNRLICLFKKVITHIKMVSYTLILWFLEDNAVEYCLCSECK